MCKENITSYSVYKFGAKVDMRVSIYRISKLNTKDWRKLLDEER